MKASELNVEKIWREICEAHEEKVEFALLTWFNNLVIDDEGTRINQDDGGAGQED